jgi:uncharacterized membrane protein YfcA
MKAALFVALAIFTVGFVFIWIAAIRKGKQAARWMPGWLDTGIGLFTNFFDTLGIGSFATTSSFFKLWGLVRDEQIPGTMNVGHTLPTVVQAFIYITFVEVDVITLVAMIGASVVGSWLGAGVVCHWPRRKIQIGMGSALLAAAMVLVLTQLQLVPGGGDRLGVTGVRLATAIAGNVLLGALMPLGIGLYAPCMILVSLLGMNPKAAFPIMMGSCAFLMPVGSAQFLRTGSYNLKSALGLALGGIPGVLLAAFLVKSLPLSAVKWLVVVVVIYTATMMLRSAAIERSQAAARPVPSAGD